MTHFAITQLSGHRALIEGTDIRGTAGQQIVDSAQWDAIKSRTQAEAAAADFDQVVHDFFAPLTDAADALEQLTAKEDIDRDAYFVAREPVVAVEGIKGLAIELTHDSRLLRCIEANYADPRLLWVNGELEILVEPALPSEELVVDAGSNLPF